MLYRSTSFSTADSSPVLPSAPVAMVMDWGDTSLPIAPPAVLALTSILGSMPSLPATVLCTPANKVLLFTTEPVINTPIQPKMGESNGKILPVSAMASPNTLVMPVNVINLAIAKMQEMVIMAMRNDLNVSFNTPNALPNDTVLLLMAMVISVATKIAVPVALPKSSAAFTSPSPGITSKVIVVNDNTPSLINIPLKNGILHTITAMLNNTNGIQASTICPVENFALLLSSSATKRKMFFGFHWVHKAAKAAKESKGGTMSTNSGPKK